MGQVWSLLKGHKAWWLPPVILAAVLLGLLVAASTTSSPGPFVYTVF